MEKLNSSDFAIKVLAVNKSYINGKKKTAALANINLTIKAGTLFGLIGPDGAGKTSLIRLIQPS